MKVSEAIAARRSIRQFSDRPVEPELLRNILEKARNAPSGGNVQPWNATILTGSRLNRLKEEVRAAMLRGANPEQAEYAIYPAGLAEPYRSRRSRNGEAMYHSIGLERDNKMGRMMHLSRNFEFFGAPVGLLLHTPAYMGPPQWADMGMWLQTLMLLLVESGLGSCAQESWSTYPETVKRVAEIPQEHTFFCGVAIGYPDESAAINRFDNPRATLDETTRILEG